MGAKGKGLGDAKLTIAGNASELAPHENPLVRNETLKQMYQKMVESRLLEEQSVRRLRKGKRGRQVPSAGLEACWVAVLQGLEAGDVVMDSREVGLTGHLLGATLPAVLKCLESGAGLPKAGTVAGGGLDRLLPLLEDAEPRLFASVGAGLLMKAAQKKSVAIVYVQANEAAKGVWTQVLKRSAELNLPIIFVVLPKAKQEGNGDSQECGWAQKSGVPGIPVDASDAVALYRVAQESMGRIRADGGPVLIACVRFRVVDKKDRSVADPIEQLKGFMLGRKVCTESWMTGVERRFQVRLKSSAKVG